MNRECDLTIESAIKLREEIKKCKNEQTESEDARSAAMNIYKESLREVQQERQRLYETNIAGRRTIEVIAQRVTALYFKLKCQALPHNDESSRCNLPPALQIDRKLTTVGGGQVSEKNILNLLEAIETRSIQVSVKNCWFDFLCFFLYSFYSIYWFVIDRRCVPEQSGLSATDQQIEATKPNSQSKVICRFVWFLLVSSTRGHGRERIQD